MCLQIVATRSKDTRATTKAPQCDMHAHMRVALGHSQRFLLYNSKGS